MDNKSSSSPPRNEYGPYIDGLHRCDSWRCVEGVSRLHRSAPEARKEPAPREEADSEGFISVRQETPCL